MRSIIYEENWLWPQLGFANRLALVEFSNPMRSGLQDLIKVGVGMYPIPTCIVIQY